MSNKKLEVFNILNFLDNGYKIDDILKEGNFDEFQSSQEGIDYLVENDYIINKGNLSSEDLSKRTIKELKELLRENNLKISGRKQELIERLLPVLDGEYDIVFIDAAKSKYSIFLKEGKRLIKNGGLILADNVLYKGYVMSDYNKHKQRTAVRHLREYLKEVTEDPNLKTEILEIGDGLAITRVSK